MTLTSPSSSERDPDQAQQLVRTASPRPSRGCRRGAAGSGVTTVKSSPDLTLVVH